MKIVDAHWELRNLGVTSQDVEIDVNDSIDEVSASLDTLDSQYQVVKVPTMRLDIYKLLTDKGFSLAEASIRVSHDLKEFSCSRLIRRLSDTLTFSEMDENELSIMREQIRGGMFQTDRVILDPYFTPEQAANRYVMWMNDELERGSKLLSYKYKDQPVGFSCMKEVSEGTFYPVLGGVYTTGKALPLGSAIVFKQLEIAKSLGGKVLYTVISSNNPAVVKAYSQLGYTFEDIKYVFVKHAD